MPTEAKSSENWFDRGGQAYARFRPKYPPDLARFLASIAPSRERAVDVGCGNGQLTAQLAAYFDDVVGLDPSANQIANAPAQERVRYLCAPAEKIPLPNASTNLITVAQAAQWFQLPAFYAEARRIALPNAVIALISYGVLQLNDQLQERFNQFYYAEVGPYWPAERKRVDAGYRDIDFPFEERIAPKMDIRATCDLKDFLGYVSTWSAVQRAKKSGRQDILADFARDISELWGDPTTRQPASWPINMRIGTL